MNISIPPTTYVLAVSGGVDSAALLHALATNHRADGTRYTVAHFDHGIREESHLDRKLVSDLAMSHGLSFVYETAQLGPDTSEDQARRKRYQFLLQVKHASGARAIVTAHHQDDVLETAVFNLMRGTGRRGLSSLSSRKDVFRPLLHMSKTDIIKYARQHNLTWREDSTNTDTQYARNHIRAHVLPRFTVTQREQLLQHIHSSQHINQRLDVQLIHYLHTHPARERLDRKLLVQLPHNVTKEVLASWLRSHGLRDFDAKTLERLAVAVKTAQTGVLIDVFAGRQLDVTNDNHIVLRAIGR